MTSCLIHRDKALFPSVTDALLVVAAPGGVETQADVVLLCEHVTGASADAGQEGLELVQLRRHTSHTAKGHDAESVPNSQPIFGLRSQQHSILIPARRVPTQIRSGPETRQRKEWRSGAGEPS